MAIIRSKIARQLLAEGGAPRKRFMFGSPGSPEQEASFGAQAAMDMDAYSGMDQESQAEVDQDRFDAGVRSADFGNLNVDEGSDTPSFFQRTIDRIDGGLQNRRGQNILNFLNRSTAPTMRGRLGLGKSGDINYVLDLLQNPDDRVYGLSNKERQIGQKLIDAGIRDEFDIRNMTQSQFDNLFPGPPKGEGGDSEPIRKLRAPITEKKEEPKNEFADILKFYGARFARGGDVDYADQDLEEQAAIDAGEATAQMTTQERDDQGYGGGDADNLPALGPTTRTMGGGTGPLGMPTFRNLQTHFANNAKLEEAVRMGLITNEEYNVLGGYDARQTLGLGPLDTGIASAVYNVAQSLGKGRGNQPFSEIPGDVMRNVRGASTRGISPELQGKYNQIIGPKMKDGGEVREEYFSGGITDTFKKGIGAVKKIVKSPIGKAAILAFGAKLAKPDLFANVFAKDSFIMKNKALSGILAASLAAGALSKEEEEDDTLPAAQRSDPAFKELLEYYGGPRRFAAEGGMMEQDEMLDLGGKEMDLRGGGFVPLGEYEKKDDVPARLSKNEFVMTADAVRAAGGGSVDRGADIMYKTMKTLENKVA